MRWCLRPGPVETPPRLPLLPTSLNIPLSMTSPKLRCLCAFILPTNLCLTSVCSCSIRSYPSQPSTLSSLQRIASPSLRSYRLSYIWDCHCSSRCHMRPLRCRCSTAGDSHTYVCPDGYLTSLFQVPRSSPVPTMTKPCPNRASSGDHLLYTKYTKEATPLWLPSGPSIVSGIHGSTKGESAPPNHATIGTLPHARCSRRKRTILQSHQAVSIFRFHPDPNFLNVG